MVESHECDTNWLNCAHKSVYRKRNETCHLSVRKTRKLPPTERREDWTFSLFSFYSYITNHYWPLSLSAFFLWTLIFSSSSTPSFLTTQYIEESPTLVVFLSLSYPRIRSYQVNEKIYNNILYWLIYINHSNHVLTLIYIHSIDCFIL